MVVIGVFLSDMEKIEEVVPDMLQGKNAFFTTFGTTASKAGSKVSLIKDKERCCILFYSLNGPLPT